MKLSEKQKSILILCSAYGIGKIKTRKLLESTDITNLSKEVSFYKEKILSILNEKDYNEILLSSKKINFDKIENELSEKKAFLVTIGDDGYPNDLEVYDDAPIVLYGKGKVELLKRSCFAIIGTRNPSQYGEKVTELFSSKLSKRFCIVSGMAKGLDGLAQRVAIKNGGETIAVLGGGVDTIYPRENADLYEQIEMNGLLISEYPLGTKAEPHNFPARNKIISGISRAVLVTEAGEKSGAMLTLGYATRQGKAVYCVPSSIYNASGTGCNKAIKDCQTRMVTEVNDIYRDLGLPIEEQEEKKEERSIILNADEQKILEILKNKGEMYFDDLLEITDLSISGLNATLTKMSVKGIIVKTKQNFWSIY